MPKLLVFASIAIIGSFSYSCKKPGILVSEGIDPFSPKPGEPDSYENDNSTEVATYLNYVAGSGQFGSGGVLSGTSQKHSMHERNDQDWYKIEAKTSQRVIIETFNVSEGLSTIMQLYYLDGSNNLVKIWGTDTGLIDNNFAAQNLAEVPNNLSGATLPGDVTLNQRVWFKRDTNAATITYFVKVTIPPFIFQAGKDAIYYIRARGSGEYAINTPTNVVATRDQHSDKIVVSWNQSQGATSYRIVRDTSPVSLACSDWPCEGGNGFTLTGNQALVANREVTVVNYQKMNDNGTPTISNDDTIINSVSGSSIHEEGNWSQVGSGGALRCFSSNGSPVASINVIGGGSSYSASPVITLVGGGGSGATATATVAGGVITGINVTNGGGNYTSPPTVQITDGTGSGATAQAVLSSGTIREYNWNKSATAARVPATSVSDSIDEAGLLPSTTGNEYIFSSDSCTNLPGNASTADDPVVGGLYNYAVYACDDILQSCTAPSALTEQANSAFNSGGGGSLKISIDTPQLVYASEDNSDGIWLSWNDVNSNKNTALATTHNKRIRYSIQRSTSINGPWAEVECQINADSASTANSGLLREFDDGSESAFTAGTLYYYRVIAQQLRDGISCTSAAVSGAPGPHNRNCETSSTPANYASRQGYSASVSRDETDATDTNPTNENNENGAKCSNDSDYFNSDVVAESTPSNIITGRVRFLGNWAMCLQNTDNTKIGTVNVVNSYASKLLTLTLTEKTGSPPASTSTALDLKSGSWIAGNNSRISALCSYINGGSVPNWSCTTNCTQYGPNNSQNDVPAVLLRGTGSSITVPDNTNQYGNNQRPLAVESRVFASKGYYNNQVLLKWAPVNGATDYDVYRISSPTQATLPYINVIYHGSAVTARLKVENGILFTTLSNQLSSDKSLPITINFSSSSTDTVQEVVSYINSQIGYSAWIIDPTVKIIPASRIVNTVNELDNNFVNIRQFDAKGLPKPITLQANADKGLVTIATADHLGNTAAATYPDGSTLADTNYWYMVRANSATNVSFDFIVDRGFRRSNGAADGSTYDDISPHAGDNQQVPRDTDIYDFSDNFAANTVEYAINQGWLTSGDYGQYVQRDNDRFVANDFATNPSATPYPSKAGFIFDMKIGVHSDHDTALPQTTYKGYLGSGQGGRTSTMLPCSLHSPGNTSCVGGYSRWAGDPDIIYDDNSGSGAIEPRNLVNLFMIDPEDQDHLWFFGQKRYYEFSDPTEYKSAYVNFSAADAGCWPGWDNAAQYNGPFNPSSSGTAADSIMFSLPCTLNTSSNPQFAPILGPVPASEIGHPRRANSLRYYEIDVTNRGNGYSGEVIVDFYPVWPILETYNAASQMLGSPGITDNYRILDLEKAPLYSHRFESSGAPLLIQMPSAGHVKDRRGLGMVEFPACGSMTAVNITGGGGSGATAYAEVNPSTGAVTSVNILTNGSGYTSLPSVGIVSGNPDGSGANYAARMGAISANVANGGSGYTFGSILNVVNGDGAQLRVSSVSGGAVTAVTIQTTGASDFAPMPSNPVSVTLASGSGSGATFNINWGVSATSQNAQGSNYNSGIVNSNDIIAPINSNIPVCMANPVCTQTIVSSQYIETSSGSRLCAKMPIRGLSLCNQDLNNDKIYESVAGDTGTMHDSGGNGGITACLPAPYYDDPTTGNGFFHPNDFYYNGETCDGGAFGGPAYCPPPGMHLIMRVSSPQGSVGSFDLSVRELGKSGVSEGDFLAD